MRRRKRRNRKRRLKLRPKHRGSRKISHEVRDKVLERDNHQCQHCGTPGSTNNKLTLHHIRYRRHGGTSTPDNLLTLCRDCHDRLHRQWG